MFAKMIVLFAGALLCVAASEHGPALSKCTRNDPNVNECLKQSIQGAVRSLKDGYAPLNMVPLDPLVIGNLELFCPKGDRANLTNYNVVGLANAVCESASYVSTGANSFELSFSLMMPQFDAAGVYTMQKGFFGSDKDNAGTFTFNLSDYRADFVLDGTVSNGFATLTGKSSSFNGGTNFKVHFSDTGAKLNEVLRMHSDMMLKSYKTAIDKLHPFLAAFYANMLFQKVPFEDLFPASA